MLAATVAAGSLGRGEARQQSLGQRAFGRLEGLSECVDRLAGDEDVPLGGVPGAGPAACPVVAAGAGERGAPAGGVDDAELPLVAAVVGLGQALDDLLGRQALPQQREAIGAVARIRVRLRRDGAHPGLRPGDDRPDGQELRLHGDAPLSRIEVARHDRIRRDHARVPGASLASVGGGQCLHGLPTERRPATRGSGGAGLCPAGAGAGQGREA